MAGDGDRRSRGGEKSRLSVVVGALLLVVVGGFLVGGYVVALLERDQISLDSTALIFVLGVACIGLALLLIWDRV